MSDNLPEVRRETNIARQDTDSWIEVVGDVATLAQRISGTDFVPKSLRNNVAATAAAILYGREVGLPPMTALTQTHVIEGKPAMSAEAMRALVLAAGHQIVIEETTGAICRIRGRRAGTEDWTTIVWTIDMARAAGVANKQVWKSYPRQMLQARATTELCRLMFPDVIHGFRSLEEFDQLDALPVEDVDDAAASGTVTRRRTTRKSTKSTPAAVAPAQPPADEDGPPLPVGPELDDDASSGSAAAVGAETSVGAEGTSAGGSPEGEAEDSPADTETSGEDAGPGVGAPARETPSDAPLSVGSDGSSPEPDEDGIVDAEVVDDEAPEDRVDRGRPSTRAQHRMLFAVLDKRFGVTDDDERHQVASALVGRPIDSFNRLTKVEASQLVDSLAMLPDRAALDALVEAAEEQQ